MIFNSATVKGVKADFSKGEITLTFTVPFNNSERDTASELARYVDSEQAGDVRLEIYPRQMSMTMSRTDHHPAEYTGFKQADTQESDAEMLVQVYALAKQEGEISVSKLQRTIRIGYARAARIIDAMFDARLISTPDERGVRKWLGPQPFEDAPAEEATPAEVSEQMESQDETAAPEEAKEPTNPLIDFADKLCSATPDDEQTPQDDANIEDTGIDDDRDPRD